MGIYYCLANHKDKTCYEVGKGSWYSLVSRDGKHNEELLYEEEIYDIIVKEIWDHYISDPGPGETADSWRQQAKKIAAEIYKFVNDADPSLITLANDSDDSKAELREKGYRWIGSRFEQEDLAYLNRHLKT